MKKIRILSAVLLSMLCISLLSGQEKKTERRIKVVVSDKPETETILDTTFSSNMKVDSLKLRDGSVVYIGSDESMDRDIPGKIRKKVLITSSAGVPGSNTHREITVTSSDSAEYNDAPEAVEEKEVIISDLDNDSDKQIQRHIYVNSNGGSHYRVINKSDILSDEENDSGRNTERTKYVIAKDGIVVTIEGDDLAKVGEIKKEVEKKLGIGEGNAPKGSGNRKAGNKTEKKK